METGRRSKLSKSIHSNTDVSQIIATLKLECRLCYRRIWIYLVFLLIPIIGFSFVKLSGVMSEEFLKPIFDEVLSEENVFGKPFEFRPNSINLPILQNGVYKISDDIEVIPSNILYHTSEGVDFDTFSKYLPSWNITYFDTSTKTQKEKLGVEYEEIHGMEAMDETLYDELYEEEFEKNSYNEYLGGYHFEKLDQNQLQYTIEYEKKVDRKEISVSVQSALKEMKNNYTSTSSFCRLSGIAAMSFECEELMGSVLMGNINSAYIRQQTGTISLTRISQFPFNSNGFGFNSDLAGDYRAVLWLPIMFGAVLLLNVYVLISDKEQGHRSLMSLMGLRTRNYKITKFLVLLCFYFVYAYTLYFFGRFILQFRVFTMTSFWIWFIVFLGHGLNVTSFSFLLSTPFKSAHASMVPCLLIGFAFPRVLGMIDEQVLEKGSLNMLPLEIVFPFQFVDSTIQLLEQTVLQKVYTGVDFIWSDLNMGVSVLSLYIFSVVYFLLSLYFEQILPQHGMVRKSPFFIIKRMFLCLTCCPRKGVTCTYRWLRMIFRESDLIFPENDEEKEDGEEEVEDFESYLIEAKEKNLDDDVVREGRVINSMDPEEVDRYGIVVNGLKKRYTTKGKWVVDNIHFRVGKDECFGLLGENGAGKTTAIRMMTGQISISGGSAHILGKNVRKDAEGIRRSIGVCPQHDILFPELTAREHLEYYAAVRGISVWRRDHHVQELLKETELLDEKSEKRRRKRKRREEAEKKRKKPNLFTYLKSLMKNFCFCCSREPKIKNLSAGERRRLSIAISIIGKPQAIFLDEPTTGLGPATKRHIWTIIERLKKNKSIVLTTHSMEEADVLSDRLGIMSKGTFKCIGSSLHLKEKFGQGYRLKVIYSKEEKDDPEEEDKEKKKKRPPPGPGEVVDSSKNEVIRFINSLISSKSSERRIVLDFAQTLIWEINQKNLSVSHIMTSIEQHKSRYGIKDWSLNQATLKDVFLYLVSEKSGNKQIGDLEKEIKILKDELLAAEKKLEKYNDLDYDASSSSSSSSSASTSSEDEEREGEGEEEEDSTQEMIEIKVGEDEDDEEQKIDEEDTETDEENAYIQEDEEEDEIRDPLRRKTEPDVDEKSTTFLKNPVKYIQGRGMTTYHQFRVLFRKELNLARRSAIISISHVMFGSLLCIALYVLFYFGTIKDSKEFYEPHPPSPLYSCQTFQNDGKCYQFVYATNDNPFGDQVIQFLLNNYDEEVDGNQILSFKEGESMKLWMIENPNRTISAVEFSNVTSNPTYPMIPQTEYTIFYNSTTLDQTEGDLIHIVLRLQQMIDEAILNLRAGYDKVVKRINIQLKSFPRFELINKPGIYDVFNHYGPPFFCTMVTFVIIYAANDFVAQKAIGFHSFLKTSGMGSAPLCCSYTVFFVLFGAIDVLLVFLVGYFIGIPVVKQTNFFIFTGLFLLFFLTLLSSLTLFLPFMNKRADVAAFISFIVFIFFYVCSLFDVDTLYSTYTQTEDSPLAWWLLYVVVPVLFSPINFCKIFADLNFKALPQYDFEEKRFDENEGYGFGDLFVKNSHEELGLETEMTSLWVGYLVINIVVYCSLGLIIHLLLNARIYSLYDYIIKRKIKASFFTEEEDEEEDEEERFSDDELVSKKPYKTPLVIKNVKKDYSNSPVLSKLGCCFCVGKKRALNGVNLQVHHHELVGLLGHNSAGKTSLINLVSGMNPITKGNIYVNHKSIKTYASKIQKRLGIVPQYDVLIDKLTAREHLEIFGLCKGLERSKIPGVIDIALKRVGLDHVANSHAGTFSGGMKRRLSVAITMMGDNDLILADECTTGVDPYSCYKICKILYDMKKTKSVLMVTHDMQEAELLSDRIAILHDKKIKAFANPLELKAKYDTGYTLSLLLKESVEDEKEEEEGEEEKNKHYEDELNKFIEEYLPRSQLKKSSLNFFVYQVGRDSLQDLAKATKRLEELGGEKGFVSSWGVNQCTLEDVYLKVTLDQELEGEEEPRNYSDELIDGVLEEDEEEEEIVLEENVLEEEEEEEEKVHDDKFFISSSSGSKESSENEVIIVEDIDQDDEEEKKGQQVEVEEIIKLDDDDEKLI